MMGRFLVLECAHANVWTTSHCYSIKALQYGKEPGMLMQVGMRDRSFYTKQK